MKAAQAQQPGATEQRPQDSGSAVESTSEEPGKVTGDHSPNESELSTVEESFETAEAYQHFKLLVDFIDQYLAKPLDKLKAYRDRRVSQVAFEDLWMLYDSGETICCHSRRGGASVVVDEDETHETISRDTPQAYRVVAVMGGIRLEFQSPETSGGDSRPQKGEALRARDLYSPLMIDCYYLDCDGSRYDCVSEKFHIKPFDGEVDVTSLEAFPVGFDQKLKPDYFENRGLTFLSLSFGFAHRQYEALTVGTNSEEVNELILTPWKL